jgi:hypothetical protein
MQRIRIYLLPLLFLIFIPTPALSAINRIEWPLTIDRPGGSITMYQPQLLTFKGINLTARAAVSATPKGQTSPFFGTVWITAKINTNRDEGTVHLERVFVTQVRFPGATDAQVKILADILKKVLPAMDVTVPLDLLVNMMNLVKIEKAEAEQMNTAPPVIRRVTTPTVLISIDGQPILRNVDGTNFKRVVNTPALLVQDQKDLTFYLRAAGGWWSSKDVLKGWKETDTLPEELAERFKLLMKKGSAPTAETPTVKSQLMVVTKPTALIEIDGEAELGFVAGSNLFYVINTDREVFVLDNRMYLLLSGRWFTSLSPDGPWIYVPPDQLPEDFKTIGDDFERAYIRAHVPETDESQQVRMDTFIPQTAAIKRSISDFNVVYDGEPIFENIKSTQMNYALNSPFDIIEIQNHCYCCYDGVWFDSSSRQGPWTVSTTLPPEIQTIPPSCPLYHVKYAQIYDFTEDVVYVGYTPGYLGAYVLDYQVVFGTGYQYEPWNGNLYFPRPPTYGFSAVYDPGTAAWFFKPKHLNLGGLAAAFAERLRNPAAFTTSQQTPATTPGGKLLEGFWGPNGYRMLGVHFPDILQAMSSGQEASPQGDQPAKDKNLLNLPPTAHLTANVYLKHQGWLAEAIWGQNVERQLVKKEGPQVGSANSPPPPEPTEEQPESEEDARRWEALRKQSEAETSVADAEEAQKEAARAQAAAARQDNLVSDDEGRVYRKNQDQWEVSDGDNWNDVQDSRREELDRYNGSKRRGVIHRRDLIHSTGSLSKSRGFDASSGDMSQGEYRDFLNDCGIVTVSSYW